MIPLHHALSLQHLFWVDSLKEATTIIDLTCGNGKDVSYILEHARLDATIYAIDIQEEALDRAREGIPDERVVYLHGSHDKVLEEEPLPKPYDLVIANLGYLPKGDHSLHTQPHTTIKALQLALYSLKSNGLCTVVAYPGTEEGRMEQKAVKSYLETLSQQEFDVSTWYPINQINHPPILYIIRRRPYETVSL